MPTVSNANFYKYISVWRYLSNSDDEGYELGALSDGGWEAGDDVPNIFNPDHNDYDFNIFKLSTWDVSGVTTMEDAFKEYEGEFGTGNFTRSWSSGSTSGTDTTFDANITNWNCSSCLDFCSMFRSSTTFNQDISGWGNGSTTATQVFDRSGVSTISFARMFRDATLFNQDISGWKVASVNDFEDMFRGATAFTQDLSSWKTNGNGMQSLADSKFTDFWTGATAHANNGQTVTYATWTTTTCFYGFVNVMTKEGLKQIKDLKRGDLILTNDGYQPLAKLDTGFNHSDERLNQLLNTTNFMVKIPKDFLAKNVPSEDVYVTDTHPLSVRVTSDKNDKDFEFLHLFVRELMKLNGNIEYVRLNEKYLYNLIFDKHYEINVGGMKFLSHHPNHFNGNVLLLTGDEIEKKNRSKKIYALNNQIYFDIVTLKDLLKNKPGSMSDKEYLASVLTFDVAKASLF